MERRVEGGGTAKHGLNAKRVEGGNNDHGAANEARRTKGDERNGSTNATGGERSGSARRGQEEEGRLLALELAWKNGSMALAALRRRTQDGGVDGGGDEWSGLKEVRRIEQLEGGERNDLKEKEEATSSTEQLGRNAA